MRSNIEWEYWGKTDPRFGVATSPGKERGGAEEWTDEAFYEMGALDWEDFAARWERYGMNTTSCVEIGCGAGRLTGYLAKVFCHVHAIDVSPEMVAYAKDRIAVPNVTYHLTEGSSIPLASDSVTAVFSTHVFQHFDSPQDANRYFREAFRVLSPGGSLMIHLPVHDFPSKTSRFTSAIRGLYAAKKGAGNLRAAVKRRMIRAGMDVTLMRGLSYDITWVINTLASIGFADVEIAVFPVRSNGNVHPFVFAKV